MAWGGFARGDGERGLLGKLAAVNWGLVVLIAVVSSIGFAMQYSAAGGSLEPGCFPWLFPANVTVRDNYVFQNGRVEIGRAHV